VIVSLLTVATIAGILASRGRSTGSSPAASASPASSGAFPLSSYAGPSLQCGPLPARVATPRWLPADFPFPRGTYTTQTFPRQAGTERAIFTVAADLDGFVSQVIHDWPRSGYRITSRGERETLEAEAPFEGPGGIVGGFRARIAYCDRGYVEVLLVLTLPG
jgi:hypothetical protein